MPSLTTVRYFTMPNSLADTLVSDSARSMDNAKKVNDTFSEDQKAPLASDQPQSQEKITFAAQDKLPKLPIPELDNTLKKYLAVLKPLQGKREHAETQQAVDEFLKCGGSELQEKLKKYAAGKTSYIEDFCRCNQPMGYIPANNIKGTTLTSTSTIP